jgi:hypothetical protein
MSKDMTEFVSTRLAAEMMGVTQDFNNRLLIGKGLDAKK